MIYGEQVSDLDGKGIIEIEDPSPIYRNHHGWRPN